MNTTRFSRDGETLRQALAEVTVTVVLPAGAAANGLSGTEAFHSVAFNELLTHVIEQLRNDGTHGIPRDLAGARAVYEHNVPAEAHGSLQGVEAITNDPDIHWMRRQPFAHGGSNDASNGVYGPAALNHAIGDRPMTPAAIHQAHAYTRAIAHDATSGVTGDLPQVAGLSVQTAALGSVMGGGITVLHHLPLSQER